MAWELKESTVKPLVCVCIPHTRHMNLEFVNKCYIPLIGVPHPLFDKIYQLSSGTPLPVSRESMVENGLSNPKTTHIFFIDTDMVPEDKEINDIIAILLQLNSPIACGLYRARKQEGFFYAAWYWGQDSEGKWGYLPIMQFTGNWFQCDVTGLGCALIKREVFEKTPRPWFPWEHKAPSEDFSFFIKAEKVGYKPWIFAEVRMSHIGELVVRTDGKIRTLEV